MGGVNQIRSEDGEPLADAVELFFETVGLPISPIMEFALIAESQVWDITDDYSSPPIIGDFFLTDILDNPHYTPTSNNLGQSSSGLEFVTDGTTTPGYEGPDVFGYGLYRVTNNLTNDYFYLDYRDQRTGFYDLFSVQLQPLDIWIRFSNGQFSYTPDRNRVGYQNVSNGEILKIWELKQAELPRTYLFPDFWSNALAVVNNGNNHPKLVWSAYPNSNLVVKHYRVYRAVTQNTFPPPTPNFTLLKDNISPSTFEYTDINYALGGPLRLHYKITAMVEDPELGTITETSASNVKEVGGGFYKTGGTSKNSETINFLNNHPNPFNPKTNISFHLNNSTYVTLSVYGILGNLVSVLIDDNISESIHQVTFDGSSLSSGVYLLVLMAEGKMISKKMLLSK